MKSKFADYFNHDEEADGHDTDVSLEDDPVRAGYRELFDWVGRRTPTGAVVLDLGSGTGNTTGVLPLDCEVAA